MSLVRGHAGSRPAKASGLLVEFGPAGRSGIQYTLESEGVGRPYPIMIATEYEPA